MKRTVFSLALAFSLLAVGFNAPAAPFDPKDVASDPAILFHLDFDALSGSSIGKEILADPLVQKKLSVVAALFSFDFRSQAHGLTIYTREDHPKDGVLIVYADFDPNRLTALAQAADGSESSTNGSHVIYSWINKKKDGDDERVYGAIVGHRVLFGQKESDLIEGLNVIDGKASCLTAKDAFPPPDPGESVIVQGVVLKFPIDSADQNAAIFKMSKSVRLKLSETGDNIVANLNLEAADTNTATQINAIAQGLLAVLKLQKTNADVLELANAVGIKQNGCSVAVALSMPAAELSDKVKAKEKAASGSSSAENK